METLKSTLGAVVEQASFDLKCTEIANDGGSNRPSSQRVSAAQLREAYLREQDRAVKLYAVASVPDAAMTKLVDDLSRALGEFIHPDTGMIGHAFPVDGSDDGRCTYRDDGLVDEEFLSPVGRFASALLQAAAIMGVEKAVGLMSDWKRGEPVEVRMCTVLNGLLLDTPLSPQEEIRIVPMPLRTAELPRLPTHTGVALTDYLGLPLLTVRLSASPALFRPDPGAQKGSVRSSSVNGVNLDLICDALSLQSKRPVSASFMWHEYSNAAAFCLRESDTWGPVDNRFTPRARKFLSRDSLSGEVTMTPLEDAPVERLDEEDLCRIIEGLCFADRKLRIAANRWKQSKRGEARLEDRYIDLRIALEALYLKDFDDERTQEMRFRLALFGAWHLAEGPDDRQAIRKTLRDAYDMASKAVHGGEVLGEPRADLYHKAQAELARAQDLCRKGILKLLREGPPKDWGALVLGG